MSHSRIEPFSAMQFSFQFVWPVLHIFSPPASALNASGRLAVVEGVKVNSGRERGEDGWMGCWGGNGGGDGLQKRRY